MCTSGVITYLWCKQETHTQTYTYTHSHKQTHTHAHTCTWTHTYAHMRIHTRTHTHTHSHTPGNWDGPPLPSYFPDTPSHHRVSCHPPVRQPVYKGHRHIDAGVFFLWQTAVISGTGQSLLQAVQIKSLYCSLYFTCPLFCNVLLNHGFFSPV